MDIRTDVDSEETDQYAEDELLGDEVEVVDVAEEPFIPDTEPQRMPSPPSRKPGIKKPLLVITVVILVVLVAIILYIYFPRAPTSISLIADESGDGHGLRLNAGIASESATESSGTAKITITFEGEEVYNNDNWKVRNNIPTITIPYNEFVMENGIYTIDVEFQGVSDTTTYDKVNFVIEDVDIEAFDPTQIISGQSEFEFTLRATLETEKRPPRDADLKVVEIVHEDGMHQVTSGIDVWESVTNQGQYQDTFEYEESGNYTVTIGIRNNDVKSSSNYYDYEVEGTVLINAEPEAVIETTENDGNEDGQVVVGTTVHFDGSDSIDDGDNIVEYEWYFEDTRSYDYGVEVDHQFNTVKRNPESPAEIWPWSITLTVTDNGHGEEGKSHLDLVLIKVTPT